MWRAPASRSVSQAAKRVEPVVHTSSISSKEGGMLTPCSTAKLPTVFLCRCWRPMRDRWSLARGRARVGTQGRLRVLATWLASASPWSNPRVRKAAVVAGMYVMRGGSLSSQVGGTTGVISLAITSTSRCSLASFHVLTTRATLSLYETALAQAS